MRSRLLAGAILLLSGALAWATVLSTLAARVLQALVAFSILYVAYLALRGWRAIGHARGRPVQPPEELPWVTVLVPARDEEPVIADLVRDLAAQAYADARGPRFDVLVIDDGSTDATAARARAAGGGLAEGLRVERREAGGGPRTKGAALVHVHHLVRGEIVAVIDADSRVSPDYLATAVAAWQRDPGAAALQTRRVVLNAASGWLPAAQDDEQLMDLASQCGRSATDGTAELRGTGMFVRRDVLERIGGWNPRALTEDLDISTRLSMAGEHITMAPEAIVREEAVESVAALWQQRMRWAEGSVRRLIELGPRLLASRRLPRTRRLDFLLFTTEFLVPPLFVWTIAASMVTVALPRSADWTVPATLFAGYGLGTLLLGAAGLAATGARGWAVVGRAVRGALFLSHWLMVVPIALLKICFDAPSAEFVRTPRIPHRDR